ncbi:MAG: (2Fe-2S)-binding protein [Clostridia bacterium]
MSEITIKIKINGNNRELKCTPETSLLRLLRNNFYYDVKCGCEEGDCGTCTVMLDGRAVKSCVTLAAACDGHSVETVRGLGDENVLTQKLQDAFVECGSVQCGFCTPGMIVAATEYICQNGKADRHEIRKAMSGNLCRCTGYQKIIDAIYKVAKEAEQ